MATDILNCIRFKYIKHTQCFKCMNKKTYDIVNSGMSVHYKDVPIAYIARLLSHNVQVYIIN